MFPLQCPRAAHALRSDQLQTTEDMSTAQIQQKLQEDTSAHLVVSFRSQYYHIGKVRKNDDFFRKEREKYFIRNFNTLASGILGMNKTQFPFTQNFSLDFKFCIIFSFCPQHLLIVFQLSFLDLNFHSYRQCLRARRLFTALHKDIKTLQQVFNIDN